MREQSTQKRFGFRLMIFDGGDGAGNGANLTGTDGAGPCVNEFGGRLSGRLRRRLRHGRPAGSFEAREASDYYLLFFAEELPGNDQALNFAGTFADGAQLHVTIILFRGIVLNESVA